MTAITSTAYSRDLGDELRRLRENSTKLGGRALAVRLGWDPSKVSNIEHGKARASEVDLAQYMTLCGKDTDYFEEFKRRYRYCFDDYVVQVRDNLRTIALAESAATKIVSFEPLVVPGLVQTPGYADARYRLFGLVSEERIPELVRVRTDRQSILRRHDRADCLFYVHEVALQQRVGSDKIMEDQYLRLLFNTHIVRIVPADVVVPSSGCLMWEFDKASPVAYSETDFAHVFVQESAAITRTRLFFDHLAAVALNAEQSRNKLAEYVGRPWEELEGSRRAC